MAESELRARVAAAFPDMCARLAAGELVKDILKAHGLERKALSTYVLTDPAYRRAWDEAREASADAFMDEAFETARDPYETVIDGDGQSKRVRRDPQQARLLVDTLKWAARIRNPRTYSDKSTVDLNVRTVDLTAIIRDANARLSAQQQGRIIDATPSNSDTAPVLAHVQAVALEHIL